MTSSQFVIPSLVHLCLEAAPRSDTWRLQRRTLERLPGPLAKAFFDKLLAGRQMTAPLLELFQRCVEDVDLIGYPGVDNTWLAYLGGFQYLRSLHLDGIRSVTDGAIWYLAGIQGMEVLSLNRCARVTDGAISHILSLSSLQELQLSETGVGPRGAGRLGELTALTRLDLGGIGVTDTTFCELLELSNLRHLDIWGSAVTDDSAAHLPAHFPGLKTLNLAWTPVTRVPPLSSLQRLNLASCHVTSLFEGWPNSGSPVGAAVARAISSAGAPAAAPASLEELILAGASLDDSWRVLGGPRTRSVRVLDLARTNASLACLRGMTSLEELDVSSTPIDDASLFAVAEIYGAAAPGVPGVGVLAGLPHLRSIDLRGAQVADAACLELASVTRLTAVILTGALLSDSCLPHLAALPRLERLRVGDALLTDVGLRRFSSPPPLRHLDLSGCWLLTRQGLAELAQRCPRVHVVHELAAAGPASSGAASSAPTSPPARNAWQDELTANATRGPAGAPGGSVAGGNLAGQRESSRVGDALLTDVGLRRFSSPPPLRHLDLSGCWLLTRQGLAELAQRCPRVHVVHELAAAGPASSGAASSAPTSPPARNAWQDELTANATRGPAGAPGGSVAGGNLAGQRESSREEKSNPPRVPAPLWARAARGEAEGSRQGTAGVPPSSMTSPLSLYGGKGSAVPSSLSLARGGGSTREIDERRRYGRQQLLALCPRSPGAPHELPLLKTDPLLSAVFE
eukprot:jgi/Mesen1/5721/ME000289S04821